MLPLLRACHAGPTAAVTIVSALLAIAVGHDVGGVVLVAGAVLAGQLSIGWSNDWIDAGRDVRMGRKDKPVVLGQVEPRVLRAAAALAAAACVGLSLANGVVAGVVHLVAVAAGWAYNLGMKATVGSVVPYAVAFGLLPAFVVAALPGAPLAPAWARCSARVRTSRTCCPISRTIWRPACAGSGSGSGAARVGRSRPCSCSARWPCSSSGRRGRRRRSGSP